MTVTKKRFWDFLLSLKGTLPRSIYKKAILRGQLTLLAITVGLIYIVIDYINAVFVNMHYYIILIIFSTLVLFLNKRGHFNMANIIYLTLLNLLIYIIASQDTHRSGVYTYFIVCSLTALTLCGFEQLKLGIFFCLLSFSLFVLSYILKIIPDLPKVEFTESYVTIAFITNFTVSLITVATLLLFLIDINHRTEKELTLKNELLTKTNEELDRFVYSASHDLRSPLSSILGLVEVARISKNPEEVTTCLNLIADRVKTQDTFIQEIIDYARNTRTDVAPEKFQLKKLVLEIVDQLRYDVEAREIDFQVLVEADTTIHCDKVRLTSVLSNLIGNSIKYHDASKTNRFVKISARMGERSFVIFVEDNGQGVPQKFHHKIFDMFFRASETSKGSGLGLFIAKEIVEKMGGQISLQSDFGKGSSFSVTLPHQVG